MASSPREIEERTRRMRERTAKSNTTYVIRANITHAGKSGIVTGQRTGNCEVTFNLGTEVKIREDEIQGVIDFLTYAREECKILREKYDAVDEG